MNKAIRSYFDAFKAELEACGVRVTLDTGDGGHMAARCVAPNGATRSRTISGSPRVSNTKIRENYARQDAKRMAKLLGVA